MEILKKLQGLPENTKKIISWAIAITVGIVLFLFWIQGSKKRLEILKKENIFENQNFPSFNEELDNIKEPAREGLAEMNELLQQAGSTYQQSGEEIDSENK